MQAPWWWSKTETCRSDIYVYFNVIFNVFFKIKKWICWWVNSTYIKMHSATIKVATKYLLWCFMDYNWNVINVYDFWCVGFSCSFVCMSGSLQSFMYCHIMSLSDIFTKAVGQVRYNERKKICPFVCILNSKRIFLTCEKTPLH